MYSAYLVFARRQIHVADGPHGAKRAEEALLLDSYLPSDPALSTLSSSASSYSAEATSNTDTALRKLGLPKSSVVGEFCFPRRRTPDDAAGLVPSSLYFCFTLTQPNGERVHGFSARCFSPSLERSNRLDVGSDWVECSVLLSRHYLPRVFPRALQICRVRRYLDRASCLDFLAQLHASAASEGTGRLLVESSSLNIACKYDLSTSASSSELVSVLFDTTTHQMLHYLLGAMLLERRLLFVARNEQRLSDTMYALDSLLVQMNSPTALGYPHNFVPVLPLSMLEQGAANPTPYMVGLLRAHLKAMDALKDLGDVVIVDLDNKQIRLSPGSAPLVPLGIDTTSSASSSSSSATPQQLQYQQQQEDVNPWLNVTTPFSRDVAQSYAQRDADLLTCTVKALFVHLAGPSRLLDDPSLRAFLKPFAGTSIYKMQRANSQTTGQPVEQLLVASRGFAAFRAAYAQAHLVQGGIQAERQSLAQVRQCVLELTSAVAKDAVHLVNKPTTELAKRSFDALAFSDGIHAALQQRYADPAARNWKLIYRALGLALFLVRAGSELCVAQLWDDLKPVFDFTRYSVQGVVGISSKVAEFVQRRAQELYSLVVDMHALAFARSMSGHIMVQRSVRIKMQTTAKRLPLGSLRSDLNTILNLTLPDASLLDTNETSPEGNSSSIPPASVLVRGGSSRQAVPPPPPPPKKEEEPLLDLDFGDFAAAVTVSVAPPPPPPPPPAVDEPLLDLTGAAAARMDDIQYQQRARRPYTTEEAAAAAAAAMPRPARPPAPQLLVVPPASPTSSNAPGASGAVGSAPLRKNSSSSTSPPHPPPPPPPPPPQ